MRTLTSQQVKSSGKTKKFVLTEKIKSLVLEPISSGLFGFALFFTILVITKLIAVMLGTFPVLDVDFGDVILSLIGFVLMFLIKLLENLNSTLKN